MLIFTQISGEISLPWVIYRSLISGGNIIVFGSCHDSDERNWFFYTMHPAVAGKFFSLFMVGSRGLNMRRGHNQRRFGPSWVFLLYFLCNSTQFHAIWTECQIILFRFFLLIYHKSLDWDKGYPLLFLLPIFSPWYAIVMIISWCST